MADIYRISIPKKDKVFADWMLAQTHPSLSMRLLIRHFIDEHGVEDVFNTFGMELVTKGRGRKPDISFEKQEVEIIAPIKTEKGKTEVDSAKLIDNSILETGPVIEVPAVSVHGESVSESVSEMLPEKPKQSDILSEMEKMKGLMNT